MCCVKEVDYVLTFCLVCLLKVLSELIRSDILFSLLGEVGRGMWRGVYGVGGKHKGPCVGKYINS